MFSKKVLMYHSSECEKYKAYSDNFKCHFSQIQLNQKLDDNHLLINYQVYSQTHCSWYVEKAQSEPGLEETFYKVGRRYIRASSDKCSDS